MLNGSFRDLVDERNISIQEISEGSGVPYETVRNLYYGRVSDPKISTVSKLAEYFQLSIDIFIGKGVHSKDENELLENYRQCGNHGKSLINLVARHESVVARAEREKPDKHMIPCLVPTKRVENGFVYEGSGVMEIETSVIEAYTALQIVSNSYAPAYYKGDIILLEDRYPENGERALFVSEGVGFARDYFEEEGRLVLRCITGHKADIILNRIDEIECIGTYVGLIRA